MCGIGFLAMYPILDDIPKNCQCNGVNFVGANKCESNLKCKYRRKYYAQCLPSSQPCPDSWTCERIFITVFINFLKLLNIYSLY